ncbi:MAG: hypothetical protein EPN84_09030 [Legionella sp.]|nr:MAG: hypothetical protein EPN84_09030 [Legionella sp.]
MPLPDSKSRLIMDNLEEFSLRLAILIADESPEGSDRLIHIIEDAKKRYNKRVDSWMGFIYKHTRKRGPEADNAIGYIQSSKSLITRLEEFLSLVNQGEWNAGSFNYYLFLELINKIPGYKPDQKKLSPDELVRLKDLTIKEVVSDLTKRKDKQAQVDLAEEHKRNVEQKLNAEIKQVEIVDDQEKAMKLVALDPKKSVFLLEPNSQTIKWVTPEKIIGLSTNVAMSRVLKDNSGKTLSEFKDNDLKTLKREAKGTLDAFLARISLLINPLGFTSSENQMNDFCKSQNISSSFILMSDSGVYRLYWINSLCKQKTIALNEYPKLEACLKDFNPSSAEQIQQLKVCLLSVELNTTNTSEEHKLLISRLEDLFRTKPVKDAEPKVAPTSDVVLTSGDTAEAAFAQNSGVGF